MLNDAMQNEKSTKRGNKKKSNCANGNEEREKESESEEPWKQFLLGQKKLWKLWNQMRAHLTLEGSETVLKNQTKSSKKKNKASNF